MNSRKYLSEFIATFVLVFCCTGAGIVNQETGGAVTHLGVALICGLTVVAMILALGDISGAHMNPVVTVIFALNKQLPSKLVLPFILSQAGGAFAASWLLHVLFPRSIQLGSTMPGGSEMQSFAMEVLLTFILLLIICTVSKAAKETGLPAALAIGGTVGLAVLLAGPVSGASMNPVRSLSPAIISRHTEHLWIYLSAPWIGGLAGLLMHKLLISKKQNAQ